jgi:predicted  nucleic acid-binding Zn-ribbon protein
MGIFSNLFKRKEESNTFVFANKILELQKQIEELKQENVELTNSIYECENRLEAKIDKIHPVVYNIRNTEPIG